MNTVEKPSYPNLDLDVACITDWGMAGGMAEVDVDVSVTELFLPMNGEIILADAVEITFDEFVQECYDEPEAWCNASYCGHVNHTEMTADCPFTCGNCTLTPYVAPATVEWKCTVHDTACSQNYKIMVGSEWVTPDRPPCFDDTLVFEGTSHAVSWHPNQHVRKVVVQGEFVDSDRWYLSSTAPAFGALWAASDRTMTGFMPMINQDCGTDAQCRSSCADICPQDIPHEPQNPTPFFYHLEEQIRDDGFKLENVDTALLTMNEIDIATAQAVINTIQTTYADEADHYQKGSGSVSSGSGSSSGFGSGSVSMTTAMPALGIRTWTVSHLEISSVDMVAWMQQSGALMQPSGGLAPPVANAMKFISTERILVGALAWLNTLSAQDMSSLWTEIDDNEDSVISDPVDALDFFMGDGLSKNGINPLMATYLCGVDCKMWRTNESKVTAGPATRSRRMVDGDAHHGPGSITFWNIGMTSQVNTTTGVVSMSPTARNYMFSSVVTKFALYYESQVLQAEILRLAAAISAKTVSPTTSPTMSPTMSPTTTPTISPTLSPTSTELGLLEGAMGPVIYGAGGGFILIILVIIIVCLLKSGGEKKPKKEKTGSADRHVVAFENPMYDDPTAATTAVNTGSDNDTGLYDEPTFQLGVDDKENPMYASNEGVETSTDESMAGGYLDVEPDDGDDEDDDSDDEDDTEDANDDDEDDADDTANDDAANDDDDDAANDDDDEAANEDDDEAANEDDDEDDEDDDDE